MTVPYNQALVEQVSHTLDLRKPNQAALNAIALALDTAPDGAELIADLATGVGKTYIAGGLLDYLYESGVRNVVIVTPGSTILTKTVNNLTPGHRKYLRGLQSDPLVVTLDAFERGEVGEALDNPDRFKVFVFTVQSLLRPNTKDAFRAHRPHETLGQALYQYLQAADDLVVIADEHHIYFSGNARKFQAAIDDMHPTALIGLTATPHASTHDSIVYHYPLSEAIADGYVKIPVLVSRQDGIDDLRTQMADGLSLLDAKADALRAYCVQTRQAYVEPVMFIVAQTIQEATELRDILAGPNMLGSAEQVLLVTSEEPDHTLALLDTLEDSGSKIRAVVSVSMLKEGWDVRSIYVIASVRSMESQLLTEQILGRGLRLPFEKRTGNQMLDTVEVLSHHSFSALLKQARVLLEETLGDRTSLATVVADPLLGRHVPGVPLTALGDIPTSIDPNSATEVEIHLPGAAALDPNQSALFDASSQGDESHVGMTLATIDSRVAVAAASTAILTRVLLPRSPGGVKIPLFLPRVVTRWERDPFSLARVNLLDVEVLGRQFADDHAPTLTRKALDAERDETGTVHVVITDQTDVVFATQTAMPFDTIETDLVGRLLSTNGVEATVTEANAAGGVARAFLRGADVTQQTPWRAEHGRLATARLSEWISAQQTSSPARQVREVDHVRWPEPSERMETRPPADRHVITASRDFTRGYPYSGWTRAVYEINAFDAYSTEFRMAALFDSSAGVKAWVRINQTVPLRINYLVGAIQREYEPDFLVIDDQNTYWIVEGKADSEMSNPIVLAKQEAARIWVATVNASDSVHDKWAYLLASESVTANATSWSALRSGGQQYQ